MNPSIQSMRESETNSQAKTAISQGDLSASLGGCCLLLRFDSNSADSSSTDMEKKCVLGCVNSPPRPGGRITQPKPHYFGHLLNVLPLR